MEVFLQQLVNGAGQGAIYALIAVGYTMVYGILGLINFAHGDVFALAPVVVLTLYLPLLMFLLPANGLVAAAGLVIAVAVCGLVGFLIERVAYRPLRKPYGFKTCLAVTLAVPAVLWGASLLIPEELNLRPGNPARLNVVLNNHPDETLSADQITEELQPSKRVARESAAGWRTVLRVLAVGGLIYGVGLMLNRAAFRAGVGQADRLTALITAIGVSLFLQNFLRLEEMFGSSQKSFPAEMLTQPANSPLTPAPDPPPIVLFGGAETAKAGDGATAPQGGVSVSRVKLLVFGVVLALMVLLTWVVRRTRIGTAMRAVSYSHDSARLMGINVNAVISFTFVLGSALAAVGGLLFAATYPTALNPLIGNQPGVKAFTAAVVGGIGSIPGAVVGGLLMGILEALLSADARLSLFSEALSFVVLILILLFRPAGLLGRNVPEKV